MTDHINMCVAAGSFKRAYNHIVSAKFGRKEEA